MLHKLQTDMWNDVMMPFITLMLEIRLKINFQLPFWTTMYFECIHVLKIDVKDDNLNSSAIFIF